jgi:hypothetical protein
MNRILALAFTALTLASATPAHAGDQTLLKMIDSEPNHTMTVFGLNRGKQISLIKIMIPVYRGDKNKLMVDEVKIQVALEKIGGVYDVVFGHCESSRLSQNVINCSSNENEGGENNATLTKVGSRLNIVFSTPSNFAVKTPRILVQESKEFNASLPEHICWPGAEMTDLALGDEPTPGVPTKACAVKLYNKRDLKMSIPL